MAGFTFSTAPATLVVYGRDGYNRSGNGDDDKSPLRNFGRDGYNRSGGDDDRNGGLRNFGRDGYN